MLSHILYVLDCNNSTYYNLHLRHCEEIFESIRFDFVHNNTEMRGTIFRDIVAKSIYMNQQTYSLRH